MPSLSFRLLPLAPLAALCAAGAMGCGTANASATTGPDDGGLVTLDGNSPSLDADATGPSGDDGPPPDGGFCNGSGPIVPVPGASMRCTGDLGATTFLFAVCACQDIGVSGALRTDSVVPGSTTSGSGGSIGTNGALTTNSSLDVSGSVWSTGTGESLALHTLQAGGVTGDIHTGNSMQADQSLVVGGNLYVNGDVTGSVTCGQAFIPSGHTATGVSASGGITNQAVSVVPPCDCTDLLDVNSIVSGFSSSNDDGLASLMPNGLSPAPSTVSLPCGRYYFTGVDAPGPLTLSVGGRAAVFVQGDFHAHDTLALSLAPSAELDLFITGNLLLDKDPTLGDPNAPAHVRIYVGGDTLTLSGNAKVGANLYAPHANVAFASNFEMAGSLFVGSLLLSGTFTIHYDESILSTSGCAQGGGSCSSCHQCSGATPACIKGACAPCVTDSDCCAPLHCSGGRCYDNIP